MTFSGYGPMTRFPGIGLRLTSRLEATGYWKTSIRTSDASAASVGTEYRVSAEHVFEARLVPTTSGARTRKVLVEGTANGLCVHLDDVVQFANATMARMFGYDTPVELVGPRQRYAGVKRNGDGLAVTVLIGEVRWSSKPAVLLTGRPADDSPAS